jgi:hypothetical protein
MCSEARSQGWALALALSGQPRRRPLRPEQCRGFPRRSAARCAAARSKFPPIKQPPIAKPSRQSNACSKPCPTPASPSSRDRRPPRLQPALRARTLRARRHPRPRSLAHGHANAIPGDGRNKRPRHHCRRKTSRHDPHRWRPCEEHSRHPQYHHRYQGRKDLRSGCDRKSPRHCTLARRDAAHRKPLTMHQTDGNKNKRRRGAFGSDRSATEHADECLVQPARANATYRKPLTMQRISAAQRE